ncbi:MAG TPA: hypothetical protein VJ951_13365, partial [Bacteroidales bacterium]|nr:hypothetical protein [Bacteroidales bacterium]
MAQTILLCGLSPSRVIINNKYLLTKITLFVNSKQQIANSLNRFAIRSNNVLQFFIIFTANALLQGECYLQQTLKNLNMIPKRTCTRYGATLLIVSTFALGSCGNQPEAPAENDNRTSQEAARNPVDTAKLLRSDFQKELISNGRLEAL